MIYIITVYIATASLALLLDRVGHNQPRHLLSTLLGDAEVL